MKALNLHGVGDLRYEDVAKPKPGPGEVLLKIKAVGICGSDIPRVFTKGTYHFPTIIGHEFAGEIVEAEDASLVGKGAAVFPLLPCGKCTACREERYAQCSHYDYVLSTRNFGRIVTLANPVGEMSLSQAAYWQILRRELAVVGTWNSSFAKRENDWAEVIAAMRDKVIDVEPLITHRFRLEEYSEAFALMHERREMYCKVMFVLGDEAD